MDPEALRELPGTRQRLTLGALLLVVPVALGAWWLSGSESDPQPSMTVPPAAPVQAAPRDPPVLAVAASTPEAVATPDGPDEAQMCGGVWVRLAADGSVDWKNVEQATRGPEQALTAEVLAAMESSADEAAQAAAHALGARPVWQSRNSPAACKGDAVCEQDQATSVKDGLAHRDALARLAQGSVDPVVYGWAVQACSVRVPDAAGFCQLISTAQWARLDPTNAVPWIAVAANAQAQHDAAAFEEAIFRIASAERYDPGEYRMAAVLLDHVPGGEANLYAGFSLAARSVGVGASQAVGELQSLSAFCETRDVADLTRHDACNRIAEMLVKGSTTRSGLTSARMLGKRIGWPDDRLRRIEREHQALEAAMGADGRHDIGALGCEYLRGRVDRFHEFAALGEIEALRRRVAAASALPSASKSPGEGLRVSTVRR